MPVDLYQLRRGLLQIGPKLLGAFLSKTLLGLLQQRLQNFRFSHGGVLLHGLGVYLKLQFRLSISVFDIKPGIVRLGLLVELFPPLLPSFLRSEAPLLAMVIPVDRIELLCPLEILCGQLLAAGLLKPDGEFEIRFRFHFCSGPRFHAPGELFIGQSVWASLAVCHPVTQSRYIRFTFGDDALIAEFIRSILIPCGLGRPNDAAFLIDPHSRRNVHKLEGRTDSVFHVDQRREGRLGRVVPLPRRCFPDGVLCRRDDFEILTLQLLVQFLPARQIETTTSPGGPGDHEQLLATEIRKADDAPLPIRHRKVWSNARTEEVTL